METLRDVLTSKTGEEELFTRTVVQQRIKNLAASVFSTFVTCLDTLAFTVPDDSIPQTRKLIIVLSNLKSADSTINPELLSKFSELKFPDIAEITKVSKKFCADLNQKILDTYTELRFDPVIAALEPGMYTGYFDWNECLRPTGNRYNTPPLYCDEF